MSLVLSLPGAIVKVEGEALVIHVGEKPYVVSPTGQVELATRGLTFEAVNGILEQLLPSETQQALEPEHLWRAAPEIVEAPPLNLPASIEIDPLPRPALHIVPPPPEVEEPA